METTDKVIDLFRYIREISLLKYRAITDIAMQPWSCLLKDIPTDAENITLDFRDRVAEDTVSPLDTDYPSADESPLLTVHKPAFTRCPDPPVILVDWLEPDWGSYTESLRIIEPKIETDPDGNTLSEERFEDSLLRVQAFNHWKPKREEWVEKQHVILRTRIFFQRLFQVHTDLERDSETLEFMVGTGIVWIVGSDKVRHPILLKRVKTRFDPVRNSLQIIDTDADPELETLVLNSLEDIDHGSIKLLRQELKDGFYHPLDRNDALDFLQGLTHRLCPESTFLRTASDKTGSGDKIIVSADPVFFLRKRMDGTVKAIETIIENIKNTGEVPHHIIDLVAGGKIDILEDTHEISIEEQLASLSGESVEILLSKEANREQLEIAQRIERFNAVLVQGPPGTGKTHTIANLMGHFLASGKSVLVTSHTKKALTVLKEKLPDSIRNLCVSVLDDSNTDMVRSVEGITEQMAHYTSADMKKKMESIGRERKEVIGKLADVRKRIHAAKCREFEPIVVNGESWTPSKAATFVKEHTDTLSYIPGKVRLNHPLPVSLEELGLLYRSNVDLTDEEEAELQLDLPDPSSLPSFTCYQQDIQREKELEDVVRSISANLGEVLQLDFISCRILSVQNGVPVHIVSSPSGEALERLRATCLYFHSIEPWMIQVAADGLRNGGYRQRWMQLVEVLSEAVAFSDSLVTPMTGKRIMIEPHISEAELDAGLRKLVDILHKRNKISGMDLLLNRQAKVVYEAVRINEAQLTSEADAELVLRMLSLQRKRKTVAELWDALLVVHGVQAFLTMGDEPENRAKNLVPHIHLYLDWYINEYDRIVEQVKDAGFIPERVFRYNTLDTEVEKTERILQTVQDRIPLHIQAASALNERLAVQERVRKASEILQRGNRQASTACSALCAALEERDPERYRQHMEILEGLYRKYELKALRERVLSLLSPVAPEWAEAIRSRTGEHGAAYCPSTILEAWKWKQLACQIDWITETPFEKLQNESANCAILLRKMTEKLASALAWYHLLKRTESDLDMRQALQGWKKTIEKIGKGTGKRVPMLRHEARILMAKCQRAVPAWIMTSASAMDNLDPAVNRYDIIIIDEASQSDISALGIAYMAKKLIIVGDDKQVSPMAVGMDMDKINQFRNMYIRGVIPSWHLYEPTTSIYDIAATTFQPLMLREHFRCVPDIIGYSNRLSYDYKIKPLREAGTVSVMPSVINYRVMNGESNGRKKTNEQEAETLLSLLVACMDQPEYDGLTFGVISMLGEEQALLIQQKLLQRVSPDIYEQRRFLCGNAAQFQGDERDVVFLSLVDSNEGEGPLHLANEGAYQSRKQRYNVAASRARDQLWVVHSLDYTHDLKIGDLRRDLLEYAQNPKAFANQVGAVLSKVESPFEESIGKALVARGYHIKPQWEVGSYRIDMVALYQGRKVAVECDGERYHSALEEVRADMERQAILERLDWRFIRIRGSEYYRYPDKTMERVCRQLGEMGIFPENCFSVEGAMDPPAMTEVIYMPECETDSERQTKMLVELESSLLDRVKIRAGQIRGAWSAGYESVEEWLEKTRLTLKVVNEKKYGDIEPLPCEPRPISTTLEAKTLIVPEAPIGLKKSTEANVPVPFKQASMSKKRPELQHSEDAQVAKQIKPTPVLTKPLISHGQTMRPSHDHHTNTNTLPELALLSDLEVIDQRSQGGLLWIVGGDGIGTIVKSLCKFGLHVGFKPKGDAVTGYRASWWAK